MGIGEQKFSRSEIEGMLRESRIDPKSRAGKVAIECNFIRDGLFTAKVKSTAKVYFESANAVALDPVLFGLAAEHIENDDTLSVAQAVQKAQLELKGSVNDTTTSQAA